jgi:hypothetical protein
VALPRAERGDPEPEHVRQHDQRPLQVTVHSFLRPGKQ